MKKEEAGKKSQRNENKRERRATEVMGNVRRDFGRGQKKKLHYFLISSKV